MHSVARKQQPCPSNAGRWFRQFLVIYRCLHRGGGGSVPVSRILLDQSSASAPVSNFGVALAKGGGGWHKASVSDCLPLAAPIGLSPLLILTLCGPERGGVVWDSHSTAVTIQ